MAKFFFLAKVVTISPEKIGNDSVMTLDLIKSIELMGQGMAAIFVVIIVIYFAVHLILKLTGGKKKEQAE